jgi:hypothetical protein
VTVYLRRVSAVAQTEAAPARRVPARGESEHQTPARPRGGARALASPPWAWALTLATPLAIAYLVWQPPAADLAAAIYRSELFARAGYVLEDGGWYAAHPHYVIGYSLLSPPLSALIGVQLLMVVSVLVACGLFGLIAERVFGRAAARAAAVVFAFGMSVELLSGRVPYDLGLAIGLGAVLVAMRRQLAAMLVLAVLTSLASPVAGAFLAMALLAWGAAAWLVQRRGADGAEKQHVGCQTEKWGTGGQAGERDTWPQAAEGGAPSEEPLPFTPLHAALGAAVALAPIAVMSVAFPEGGYEPFALSAFWPACAGVVAIALLLPRERLGERAYTAVRMGAWIYALALAASYAIHTPMGGNAARLGPELAPALLAGVLWERRRLALALLAPLLVFWQVNTPIGDLSGIYGQQSAHTGYYTPLLSKMQALRHGQPTIVEVPLTAAHMEAAYVAGHDGIELARGWDRQLDTRYNQLFYRPRLSATTYRAWLYENRVAYVALPDARPDYAAKTEVALIARGVPYLREVWRSAHWRLFAVAG